jgi:hypothetical protein
MKLRVQRPEKEGKDLIGSPRKELRWLNLKSILSFGSHSNFQALLTGLEEIWTRSYTTQNYHLLLGHIIKCTNLPVNP